MSSYSGKFVLRLSSELHQELQNYAQKLSKSLNSTCRILLERQLNIDLKSDKSEPEFLKHIKEFYKGSLIGVVIFGSFARGTTHSTSDIDLLLILNQSKLISRKLYRDWEEHLRLKLKRYSELEISPHFSYLPNITPLSNQVGSLWLEVALDGNIILDDSGQIAKTLSLIRQHIANGKYIRKFSHGHPYWVNSTEQFT